MTKKIVPGQQPGKLPKHNKLSDNVMRVGEVDDLRKAGKIQEAQALARSYGFSDEAIAKLARPI